MKWKFFILFLCLVAIAQAQINYTVAHTTQVAPGAWHKKLLAPQIPLEIHVLEIDLTNPYMHIESAAANNRLAGWQRTSAMSAANDYEGHRVAGAINGDFYDGNGVSINAQVVHGELLKTENINPSDPKYWSTIGFDQQGKPAISLNIFSSFMLTRNASRTIDEINKSRGSNQLILYNSYIAASTGTNSKGCEVLINPLNGWAVNDTLYCLVEAKAAGAGNMAIPKGKAVLSGSGNDSTFLADQLQIGDTIRVFLGLIGAPGKLMELVGGFPRIVKDGQNYAVDGYREEGGSASFHTDIHPRTGIGFSADSTTVYFVTVDGRQVSSKGINLIDLADVMISLGVAQGMNLDGGGSTTMVVRNQVKNSPSDGNERSVANALLAVSTAPQGSLHYVQMEPDNHRLFLNESVTFRTSGWDEYYNPVNLNTTNLSYQVDAALGTVSSGGIFTATANGGSGYVYALYDGIKDSAYVHIVRIKQIVLAPQITVSDTLRTVQFRVRAIDEADGEPDLASTVYQWQSLNPQVGEVDSTGIFRARQAGTTQVVVRYAELSDTAEVHVEIGSGQMLLDSLDTGKNWELGGEYIDSLATVMSIVDTPRTFGEKAIRVDYRFTRLSTRSSWIHLYTDIPVYGIPDYFEFDFKSDGQQHRAYIYAYDSEGELFKNMITKYATVSDRYDTLRALMKNFRNDQGAVLDHPLRIESLRVKLGYYSALDEINEGTVYFDNLRAVYPQVTSIIPLDGGQLPQRAYLHPNYPNPFNPITTIAFETVQAGQVELVIYDLLGRKVETLVSQELNAGFHHARWDATAHASGIYLVRLSTAEGFSQCRKVVLLK